MHDRTCTASTTAVCFIKDHGRAAFRTFFLSLFGIALNRFISQADSALPHDSSADVREQTAELANIALSDVGVSVHIGTPPPPLRGGGTSSTSIRHLDGDALDIPPLPPPTSRLSSGRPFPSATKSTGHVWNWEPAGRTAPDGPAYGFNGGSSYLTHLFRKDQVQTPTIVEAAGSGEPTPAAEERDHLLPKHSHYGSVQGALQPGRDDDDDSHDEGNDIEAQVQPKSDLRRPASAALTRLRRRWTWKLYDDREKITKRDVWEKGVVGPVKHLPAVFLGLLLNVLDGLSYGECFVQETALVVSLRRQSSSYT